MIAKKLQELTGSKNIKLKPVIDQSLIAGFIVEYGSCQIDLSIRGQIEKVGIWCCKRTATPVVASQQQLVRRQCITIPCLQH